MNFLCALYPCSNVSQQSMLSFSVSGEFTDAAHISSVKTENHWVPIPAPGSAVPGSILKAQLGTQKKEDQETFFDHGFCAKQ